MIPQWLTEWLPAAPWAAVIGALVWVVVKVAPVARKLSHFVDDVAGEEGRPGVPARPGLMLRLQTVEEKQDDLTAAVRVVTHEVTPNHGSSMKDSQKRLEERVDAMEEKLNELHSRYVKE